MRKILITGGAGFVGRRFCKRFLDAGDEVVCVDPIARDTGGIHPDGGFPLYAPRDYKNFQFYHQDCREWFKQHSDDDFDYVLHLAAMVGGRAMIEKKLCVRCHTGAVALTDRCGVGVRRSDSGG